MEDALIRIAAIAPTCTASEVRVLIELARRAITTGTTAITASSREIERDTNLSRSNIQAAITSLNSRHLIDSDKGSATKAATHRLRFLATEVPERGPVTGPPLDLNQGQGGSKLGPPVASPQGQGGPAAGPPTHPPYKEHARSPAISILDSDLPEPDRSIARLLRAKTTDYDAAELQGAASWMHSYQANFGRTGTYKEPPDSHICAQLLATSPGDTTRIENLFYELRAERKKPGDTYAWYITVAMQRIHKIHPFEFKERRAKLAELFKRQPPTQAQQREPGAAQLHSAIAAAAAAKGMR